MSQNMVFFGGLLAGYLATTSVPDADAAKAGVRAGLVGALPGRWFIGASGVGGAQWFRVVEPTLMGGSFTVFVLVISALAGLLDTKDGVWLANKNVDQSVFDPDATEDPFLSAVTSPRGCSELVPSPPTTDGIDRLTTLCRVLTDDPLRTG